MQRGTLPLLHSAQGHPTITSWAGQSVGDQRQQTTCSPGARLKRHHDHLERRELRERCVTVCQLEQCDAHTPDISGEVIGAHLNNLGRHPAGGTHKRIAGRPVCGVRWATLFGRRRDSKVGEEDVAVLHAACVEMCTILCVSLLTDERKRRRDHLTKCDASTSIHTHQE
jgi:hypothetical protein